MVTPIVAEIIHLQPIGRMAKPYQGRGIFTRYRLGVKDNE